MANTFSQSVTQTPEASQSYERVIVQYTTDGGEQEQVLVNYDTLTAPQKVIYDDYKAMCESLMV